MTGARGLLSVFCWLAMAAGPAVAGTVYRCETGDGGRSYSSKRVPGATCTAVSSYKAGKAKPPAAAPVPVPANAGAAVPATAVAGSPVSGSVPIQAAAGTAPKRPKFLRMGSSTTYSYVDANGVRNYSNRRPKGATDVRVSRIEYPIFEMETCFACALNPKVNFGTTRLNTTAFQAEIAAAARDFGVEEAIVRAIIHAESAYRPNALSRVGAQGLMQLMPATARRFGVSNPFEPGQNIRGGVQYLSWLLRRFDGNLTLAAAGYNAGEGAVDKYKGVPPYSETRRYVERVGMLAERYRGNLGGAR